MPFMLPSKKCSTFKIIFSSRNIKYNFYSFIHVSFILIGKEMSKADQSLLKSSLLLLNLKFAEAHFFNPYFKSHTKL